MVLDKMLGNEKSEMNGIFTIDAVVVDLPRFWQNSMGK